jgi:hypothetical protein
LPFPDCLRKLKRKVLQIPRNFAIREVQVGYVLPHRRQVEIAVITPAYKVDSPEQKPYDIDEERVFFFKPIPEGVSEHEVGCGSVELLRWRFLSLSNREFVFGGFGVVDDWHLQAFEVLCVWFLGLFLFLLVLLGRRHVLEWLGGAQEVLEVGQSCPGLLVEVDHALKELEEVLEAEGGGADLLHE